MKDIIRRRRERRDAFFSFGLLLPSSFLTPHTISERGSERKAIRKRSERKVSLTLLLC